MPLADQLQSALLQGLLDLATETRRCGLQGTPADQLAIEPSGRLGPDLPVERDGRVHLDDKLAALPFVIGTARSRKSGGRTNGPHQGG